MGVEAGGGSVWAREKDGSAPINPPLEGGEREREQTDDRRLS